MATASRTLNPLHFEDLEPHRFEDMVRQLAYDWRVWAAIEAVGRLGSDEGIDIRATERVAVTEVSDIREEGEEEPWYAPAEERVWIIQCKREARLGPGDVQQIARDNLSGQPVVPYGYVIAAACDFSKKSRDAFRATAASLGVEEFYLWGKAELEDMLFQPQHDHLLFAYFGVSLQHRRRSLRTVARAALTLKRQLVKTLGEMRQPSFEAVLVRDPRDTAYPFIEPGQEKAFMQAPPWRYWEFMDLHPQNYVRVVLHEYLAYVNWDTQEWDVYLGRDGAWPRHKELFGIPHEKLFELTRDAWDAENRWRMAMPEANRAELVHIGMIPFDRIIAVDEIGDVVNKGPHLLVEYRENGSPFEDHVVQIVRESRALHSRKLRLSDGHHVSYFNGEPPPLPDPLPGPT